MARPHKDAPDRRDLTIRVRVTPAEKRHLWEMATEAGYTPSDFMRLRTLAAVQPTRRVPTPDRALLLLLMAELGKLGSNVNQIAHALNAQAALGQTARMDPAWVEQTFTQVDKLTDRLLHLLKDGH